MAKLLRRWPEALIIARWPESMSDDGWEEAQIANFGQLQEVVRAIRNLRSEKNVKPGQKLACTFVVSSETQSSLHRVLTEDRAVVAVLAGLDANRITLLESIAAKPEGHAALVAGGIEIYLPLAEMVDLSEERARIAKELSEAEANISRLEKLLGGDFANKAPAAVVQKERDKLADFQAKAEKLKEQIERLG